MAAPFGNVNGARDYGLIRQLRIACEQDNYTKMRRGVQALLKRFAETGGIREAEFLRDTLDGRPQQRIDLQGDSGNALASLQVLFVEAAQRLADSQRPAIEGEKGPILPDGGVAREPDR